MTSIIISTVFLSLIAVLLILLTLLQSPKDEGQNPIGSGGLENLVGVAQTSTFLEKLTYFLASVLVALVLTTSYLIKKRYAHEEVVVTTEFLEKYDPQATKDSTQDPSQP